MTRITGQSQNAFRRYEEALSKATDEKRRTDAAPTARARSRTFGFSLGKLGVEFTSETVDLDDESLRKAVVSGDPRARAFDVEREVAGLKSRLGADYGPDRSSSLPGTAMRTRQALSAYAATASLPESPLPVMFTTKA